MKGIIIAGPTGVGKTSLSIKLAKAIEADIISVDSAQVYKGLDIGTAKITPEEMEGVNHFMIDVTEPTKRYNVGDFQRETNKILSEEERLGKNIVMVGGTGLYINSITEGLSCLPMGDQKLRDELMTIEKDELYKKLEEVDPEAALEIHPNNRRRVERALEVFYLTGEKFSVLSKKNIKGNNYKFLKICLGRDRAVLYERINKRVDIMLEMGLIKEVEELYHKYGESLKKINIIGYNEILEYLDKRLTFDEAVDQIKQDSRKYAKRQFTWFKNDTSYIWYDLDNMSENAIIQDVLEKFSKL
ncbi:MAG: tRNA (adenosine(37)-N6)-dimethylallyltransferase MiaA [Cetobacterium sp.]|uniref:tRNA (adenosine(37)-N6)-dimethylallyltransferase MiaA n=1 Tax=unclassified Cetobacterium TaxID=2630983 RepID=UPI00163C3D2B|nr:tRNA (adenosine(37)-N6)-dimethylallyltransferase MiaA [Cetobacterium sp. 2A]MBC2856458.1 tRNA (adenosine(37)-N6)-dimethylallyltransferase MiaA [Cetobacterium sp. 2A]